MCLYIPRNWEVGSALAKLRTIGGRGVNPQTPLGTPLTHSDYLFRARNSHNSDYFPKQHKPLGICYRTVCFPVRTEFLNNADSDYFGPGQPSRYSDSLRAERSEDRFPVEWDVPYLSRLALGSTLYNGYRVSSPGAKRPGRGVDHPPPSSAEVKERVELDLFSPAVPSWYVIGRTLPFSWDQLQAAECFN
jgi:hypothetical protein